jgi:2-iminobutanoate/2-iminopropanoate deaminase
VFDNLEAVLVAAGGTLDDIVKLTTYLTHRDQFPVWRTVRAGRFREPFPASTLVIVDGLSFPDYLVEIDAIAVLAR